MHVLRRPSFWLVLGAIAVVAWLVFSRYGLLTRFDVERTERMLDQAIQRQRYINDSLAQYRQRLLSDTLLIEQLARERYGMTRPGEIVLIVADSSK